jgi:hypothetical protein
MTIARRSRPAAAAGFPANSRHTLLRKAPVCNRVAVARNKHAAVPRVAEYLNPGLKDLRSSQNRWRIDR